MKTRRNNNNLVLILNIIVSILFVLPAFKLNLLNENYSTLSLTTRGYLYVLSLGITIGLLLFYETKNIYMLIALIIGTIIPHHVPYNLQGNLHLLFAYVGFSILVISNLLSIKNKKYLRIYILQIFLAFTIYLRYSMVNTLAEVIVMLATLIINYFDKK